MAEYIVYESESTEVTDYLGGTHRVCHHEKREEIVRCLDCKKWDFMHQDPDGTEWGECAEFSHACGGHFTRMNGFCYWGERRSDG